MIAQPHQLPSALAPFARGRTTLLTSFRKDGTPVGTPVHVAAEDGRAFFRTWDAGLEGQAPPPQPRGRARALDDARPPDRARGARRAARLLEGDEAALAAHALSAKYGFLHRVLIPWVHRRKGWRTLHYELTPAERS